MTSWVQVKDGNPTARQLFSRHYTYNRRREQMNIFWEKNRNYSLIVGPGEKLVLLTPCERALFVWRKFHSMNLQEGVNCAVFRNEGAGRASDLIRRADEIAWQRWPRERRHYTYVDPKKVKTGLPGYCFIRAGWKYVRDAEGKVARTTKGLLILERFAPTPCGGLR